MHGIVDGVLQTATINGGDGTCAGYTATLQVHNCSGPGNVVHTSFPAGSQEFFIQTVFTTTGSSNDLMFYLQSDELFLINLNQGCSTPSAIPGTLREMAEQPPPPPRSPVEHCPFRPIPIHNCPATVWQTTRVYPSNRLSNRQQPLL